MSFGRINIQKQRSKVSIIFTFALSPHIVTEHILFDEEFAILFAHFLLSVYISRLVSFLIAVYQWI